MNPINAIRKAPRAIADWFIQKYADRSEPVRQEWYKGQKTIRRKDDPSADMIAERQDAVIAIAMNRVVAAIVQLPVNVMKEMRVGKETRYEPDDKHPFKQLIDEPNENDTWAEIVSHQVQSMILTGNSFVNIESAGQPFELWRLEPHKVLVSLDKSTGKPNGYDYGAADRSVHHKPEEILHHRLYSINDMYYGRSLVEPVHPELLVRYWINKQQKAFFKNSAQIDLVLSPKGDKSFTAKQAKEITNAINAEHRGVDNARKLHVTPESFDFHKMQSDNKDLNFDFLLKNSREMVLGLFGVPPFVGGVMEYANYANALVQKKAFWETTILWILKVLEDGYNQQVLRRYYPELGNHKLKFDTSGVQALQEDALIKAQTETLYVSSGIRTVDEIRNEHGWAPLPEKEPETDPAVPNAINPDQEIDEEQVAEETRENVDSWLVGFNRSASRLERSTRRLSKYSSTVTTPTGGDNGSKRNN